jgi:hypothetical protein
MPSPKSKMCATALNALSVWRRCEIAKSLFLWANIIDHKLGNVHKNSQLEAAKIKAVAAALAKF